MTETPEQTSPTEQLTSELEALRLQLRAEEAEWTKWRETHKPLTNETRRDGLHELRNRIYFLEAKLLRTKSQRP